MVTYQAPRTAKLMPEVDDPINTSLNPEPILPSSVVIAQICWDIMEEIQHAQQDEYPPP